MGLSGAVQDAVLGTDQDGSLHINTTAGEDSRVYVNGVDIVALADKVKGRMGQEKERQAARGRETQTETRDG